MRIVWPAAYYGAHRGSFVPVIERVARRIASRGDAFALVVPDVGPVPWHDELRAAGAEVRVVRPNDPRAAARATLALRPDLVHAHFDGWLVTVTTALWPSSARVLWHLHSTFQPDGGPLRPTLRRAIKFRVVGRRVERFVAVTDTIASEASSLGVPAARIAVVRNAVDGARFRPPSAAERAAARERLGIAGERAVVFFGRDPAIKGADILADALARAPGTHVVAVATPPDAVDALRRHARVTALPVLDDVRDALWAADAIAIPSRGEGMPYAALEALGCGVPVVASALPWAVELASSNPGVRLAPPGDAPAFGDALRTLLADAPVVDAGDAADLDRWAERVLALYGEAS